MWQKIFLIVMIVFCFWWLWQYYRSKPESLTQGQISKSIFTMGILALMLIAVVTLCILFLKA